MITPLAFGFAINLSTILSKSSCFEFLKIFSETAMQIPAAVARDINDAIPCKHKQNKTKKLLTYLPIPNPMTTRKIDVIFAIFDTILTYQRVFPFYAKIKKGSIFFSGLRIKGVVRLHHLAVSREVENYINKKKLIFVFEN